MAATLLQAVVGTVAWLDVVEFYERVAMLSCEVLSFPLVDTASFFLSGLRGGVLVLPPFERLGEGLAGGLEGN